jgi:hypothetical protein
MAIAKNYRYPLRLDPLDKSKVDEVVRTSGRSISQVLILSLKKGLPLARAALCADSERVTNVKPLSDHVWKRIYCRKDELDKYSADQIKSLQSQMEPQ